MRRKVLMGLAMLAAAAMPLATSAGSGALPASAAPAPAPAAVTTAAQAAPFTLGNVACSLIAVPAARGTGGVPLTTAAAAAKEGKLPVGIGTCPGVRPGAVVETKVGLCTLNFLFTAPDGERFIGTAGHCILGGDSELAGDNGGEKTWAKGTGPEAKDAAGHRIGEFAYAVLQDPKDFSLIRIDPGIQASPEMCDFGGPTGINNDISDGPRVLEYWGNGIGIGKALPARSAIALGFPNADHVYAAGLALPGDSGSAVITEDGRAVGVLVTVGIHGFGIDQNGIDAGTIGITRLAPQLARASQVLGTPLTLVTAGGAK
ncbi:MAG TPA: hypothetical protein VFE55_18180 [Acidimicrobiia bacterium]|nr:hypothetical protein [Acidimicrobiia bacterium]